MVTRENINRTIERAGISGDIGLLSIDIDGVDYWIWEAIEIISPRIVVCEYNSIFGCKSKVTVPYAPDFDRKQKHYSYLYAGASLNALNTLAIQKGYSLVASNSAGNNSFFVRNDCLDSIPVRTVEEAYVKSKFRESRGKEGQMTFLPIDKGIELIKDLPVYDLESKEEVLIKDIEIVYQCERKQS
jgi:hypothetical protein